MSDTFDTRVRELSGKQAKFVFLHDQGLKGGDVVIQHLVQGEAEPLDGDPKDQKKPGWPKVIEWELQAWISVPKEDLVAFVAYLVRGEKICQLEEASGTQILLGDWWTR